ncbi:hypothetical protein [Methylocystis sp. JR02]|uniref:hypothetical protein n=1 Tax=Methylocystis sp. JR02 TaxID=3046284 RepID=UPI0024BB4E88|nr:hypothetical protein [Methylocystis sp. JR02]MDJ0449223.1 hypothetical protein [Methylocystis sp. JR02]
MTGFSDQSQMAAIDAAIRCIRFNERPRAVERELLAAQLEFVKARIKRHDALKRERIASQAHKGVAR